MRSIVYNVIVYHLSIFWKESGQKGLAVPIRIFSRVGMAERPLSDRRLEIREALGDRVFSNFKADITVISCKMHTKYSKVDTRTINAGIFHRIEIA